MNKKKSERTQMDGTKNVFRQLIREMGIPFILAASWTLYSFFATPSKQNLVDVTSIFGGSFFLACWAFAQWFRVKKQQTVESGLGGIVKKQEDLLAALTKATERLEGHASGGKSVGWLMLVNPQEGSIRNITAHVEGDYPLIEARASVLDLSKAHLGAEEVKKTGNIQDFFKHFIQFNCGTIQPNLAVAQRQTVTCDTTKPLIRFRVEWTARNGTWTQYVELKRNGNRYDFYTAVQRGDDFVFENPKRENIPKRADGNPDVFWHTGIAEAMSASSD